MFRIRTVILSLFGRESIFNMRIRKNKKRTIDMTTSSVLSSDSAFAESARALSSAQKIAEYNRDIDAMVAISDRWAVLARTLEMNESQDNKIPMGFSFREEEEEHDHS